MIITAFLIILCCFSFIKAIDTDSTVITENIKETDLYVHKDSVFTIYLEGYYESTEDKRDFEKVFERGDDRWILENVEELSDTSIKPMNLTKSNWGSVPNASMDEEKFEFTDNYGVIAKYSFKVDASADKDLPQLKFTFKSQVKDDINVTINLLLTETEEVDIEEYEQYFKSSYGENEKGSFYFDGSILNNFSFSYYFSKTVGVSSNSSFMVVFKGKHSRGNIANSGITPPCTWFFDDENTQDFKNNKSIELISTSSRYRSEELVLERDTGTSYHVDGGEFYYMFIFKMNEVNEYSILPRLIFTLKESKESSTAVMKTSLVVQYAKEITALSFKNDFIGGKKNDIIVVDLMFDDWYLDNLEQVKRSNDIEVIQLTEDYKPILRPVDVELNSKTMDSIFKFRIKETAKLESLEPTLRFKRVKDRSSTKLVTLYREEDYEEDKKTIDDYLPVYYYEENDEKIAYVESNSILYVTIDRVLDEINGDFVGARFSYLNSNDDVKASDVIDLIDISMGGCNYDYKYCVIKERYKYLIRNVKNEDDLPTIKLYTHDPESISYSRPYFINLKLKPECSFNGYKCCSNPKKIYYHDKDGDWSIEHGDWCIIKDQEVKDTTPKLIRTCECYDLDYPCCDESRNIFNIYDYYGHLKGTQGGVDCCLHTCVYTGDYPICKTTKNVVYTDTENWGVENNEWCVLCF